MAEAARSAGSSESCRKISMLRRRKSAARVRVAVDGWRSKERDLTLCVVGGLVRGMVEVGGGGEDLPVEAEHELQAHADHARADHDHRPFFLLERDLGVVEGVGEVEFGSWSSGDGQRLVALPRSFSWSTHFANFWCF